MSGFMKLQVYRAQYADFAPSEGDSAELREIDTVDASEGLQRVSDVATGWFARYSAPGYMDQTGSVGPFETASEAARECFEVFGDTEEDSDDTKELAEILEEIETMHTTSPKLHKVKL